MSTGREGGREEGPVGAERYLRFAPHFGWPIPRCPRLPRPAGGVAPSLPRTLP